MYILKKSIQWPFINLPKGTIKSEDSWEEILGREITEIPNHEEWFDHIDDIVEFNELAHNVFLIAIDNRFNFGHILRDEISKIVQNYLEMLSTTQDEG
jgi:hypothetical protein